MGRGRRCRALAGGCGRPSSRSDPRRSGGGPAATRRPAGGGRGCAASSSSRVRRRKPSGSPSPRSGLPIAMRWDRQAAKSFGVFAVPVARALPFEDRLGDARIGRFEVGERRGDVHPGRAPTAPGVPLTLVQLLADVPPVARRVRQQQAPAVRAAYGRPVIPAPAAHAERLARGALQGLLPGDVAESGVQLVKSEEGRQHPSAGLLKAAVRVDVRAEPTHHVVLAPVDADALEDPRGARRAALPVAGLADRRVVWIERHRTLPLSPTSGRVLADRTVVVRTPAATGERRP